MISASHNPFADNGIKLFGPDGYKLSDDTELQVEELMLGDMTELLAAPEKIGRATRIDSARERYIEFAKRTLPKNLRFDGIRAVIDCANGAAYKVAPEALWELGAEVVKLGVDPDGFNINKDCGSTAPGDLIRKVNEVRADIGIALDGDADRVVIVDEKGQMIDGDQLMAVIAEILAAARARLPAAASSPRSCPISGSSAISQDLGLGLQRTPVGDRYVVEHMRQHGYNVGGEQSGPYRAVRLFDHRRRPGHRACRSSPWWRRAASR